MSHRSDHPVSYLFVFVLVGTCLYLLTGAKIEETWPRLWLSCLVVILYNVI
ncbi:unnamed protein product [Arabidopsis halleri]